MSLVPRMFRGNIWITKEGERLDPLKDMKTSHLINTIKFIQKPERLEHLKNMVEHEFYSFPEPSGDMAYLAYEESLREVSEILTSLTPKMYFEEHIMPSPLFQRLLQAYFNHTKDKDIPTPVLSKYDRWWYETGHHPADSCVEKGRILH